MLTSFNSFAQIPTDCLVGYWPLDGNYDDLSGNVNHGTAVGTIFAYDRFNNPSGCVEFNGVNGIIRVAHSDSLDLGGYQESYTVSFWCQSDDPIISGAGSARFLEKWNTYGNMPYPLSVIIVGDDIKASVYDMNNTSQPFVNDVFGDQWLNIVVVNNYDTDSVSIFSQWRNDRSGRKYLYCDYI